MISNWSGSRIKFDVDDVVTIGRQNNIFPLQTIQSMADRWGVSRQLVNNWSMRHDDFPRQIYGIIASTSKTPVVYPLFEVERYEKLRGLIK